VKTSIISFISLLIVVIFSSSANEDSQLTANEQAEIISIHNKWRAEVGIAGLQWSKELASEAQKWANYLAKSGCQLKHSSSKNGENIYWSSMESTPDEVVNDWATEKKEYKGEKISVSNYEKFGHYTQVVWENTKFVGCGKAKCNDGEEIWVCNYSPAGNYIGEYPYKKK